ncbi:MAG: MFS transporter [Candidatus Lokiarchaeota archaeon]|nr:MFS transporter [Candidatus Lokiarchaeota archaeon]
MDEESEELGSDMIKSDEKIKQNTNDEEIINENPAGNVNYTNETHSEKLARYNINKKQAFFTLMLSVFVDVLGYSMILPLLPTIASKLGASDIFVGIIIASNSMMSLIFGPIWGHLSDKYGRKPILLISQAGTFAAFLILGLSPDIYVILLARLVDGIFGGQLPVIRAYISDITTADTRSHEVGKIAAGVAFGIIFGPALGGFLGAINWRYPAFLACGMSIISIILATRLIESMPEQRIADIKKDKARRRLAQMDVKDKFLSPVLVIRYIQYFLLSIAFSMFTTSLPLVVAERFGANEIMIGVFMSMAGFLMILVSGFLLKTLIQKFGEKRMLGIAMSLLVITFIVYPFLERFGLLFIIGIPLIFGNSFSRPLIQANITKAAAEDKQGYASGWSTNLQSLAQTIAPLISTGYLEMGTVYVGMNGILPYFFIGFTCAFCAMGLLGFGIYDMKKHSDTFVDSKDLKNRRIA